MALSDRYSLLINKDLAETFDFKVYVLKNLKFNLECSFEHTVNVSSAFHCDNWNVHWTLKESILFLVFTASKSMGLVFKIC